MALTLRVLAAPPGAASSPTVERSVAVDEHLAEIRFGRRAGLEVELPFAGLAPIHARLVRRGAGWLVEDMSGAGDSIVDGVALVLGQPRPLVPGSIIQLARLSIVFEGVGSPVRAGESTATIARRLVSDLFGAGGGQVPQLAAVAGWPSDQAAPPPLRLAIPDRPYLVGRGEDCDLVLASEEVSREHAVLVRRWEGIHIRDLGSKNGVRVAGRAITGEARLRDGDAIEIGPIALRLDDPEDRYLRDIEAQDRVPGSAPAAGTAEPAAAVEAPVAAGAAAAVDPLDGASRRTARVAILVASLVLLAIAGLVVALIAG
jgi:pSer/pThr/pTyr-binding forkhead associated (FHA) protein